MDWENVFKEKPKYPIAEQMRQRGIKERGEEERSKEFDFLEGEKPEEEIPRREEIADTPPPTPKINFNTLYGSLLTGQRYTLGDKNVQVPKITNYITNKRITDAGMNAFERMVLELVPNNIIPRVHTSKFSTLRRSMIRTYSAIDYFFTNLVPVALSLIHI